MIKCEDVFSQEYFSVAVTVRVKQHQVGGVNCVSVYDLFNSGHTFFLFS